MQTNVAFNGVSVTVERQMIEVSSWSPRPDPDWVAVDQHGHEHRRDGHGYPTLEWVIDDRYWCADCGDEHEDGHLACRICGDEVVPGTLPPSPFPEFIPGPMSGVAEMDDGRVYRLTPDDFAKLQSGIRPETMAAELPESQRIR